MKFTLSWLLEHLETESTLDEIVERLSLLGLEVEGVEDRGRSLQIFRVAYVKEAAQHPDADRLKVCTVDTGDGEEQVVCGAPNARTGMKGVFAPVGAWIPGTEMELKAGKIRGVESRGMLVSEREMGLSDEHTGIMEMPEDAPVGAPFAKFMGLDDPVIEIAITPNRADCLGVRGVARDLAAAGLGRLKPLKTAEPVEGGFESPMTWKRDLPADKAAACPYVGGRYFRGVSNGESPKWMQDRLRAIGLRPISALVDITNYVSYDLARPLHVYDAKTVSGDLTMRMAREGESLEALDERTYELDEETVIIADDTAVHGIGGIMGGEDSGVTGQTTEVFLEVALFDPVRVATSGRRLGIHSDARYRFERGVDPTSAVWGVEVATRLILEICGGEASAPVSAGELPDWQRQITLRPARIAELGGLEVPAARAADVLGDLGFEVNTGDGLLTAAVPPWRGDVEGEADLVEEVLRILGYDEIPVVPLTRQTTLSQPAINPRQKREHVARTALAWRGMEECVTFSFMSGDIARHFGGVPDHLRLVNPISSDLDVMRPSILPNLLQAAGRNADRGFGDVALFELGPEYHDDTPDGQRSVAAGVRAGRAAPRHWASAQRGVDVFDAKADALGVLEACGAPVDNLQTTTDAPGWYHPGRSGVLRLGKNVLAQFGEVHPRILKALELRAPVVAFEIFLHDMPEPRRSSSAKPMLKLSPFQPVERDFAFVVDADVPADKVLRAAKGADKQLVTEVKLFDVYQGEHVGEGRKSLAIAVTLQPRERTLTDEEIEEVGRKVVAQVEKATGGVLRG